MLRFGFVFLACIAGTAVAQLRYESRAPVILHEGAGSAEFTLTNIGKTVLPLALRTGSFTDDTTQMTLAAPKVTFLTDTGGIVPTYVLPGQVLRIELSISDLTGSSAASATLFDGITEIGKLQALEGDARFDVSISGNGSPDQRLILTDGGSATLILKNGDAEAYPVEWSFQIGGQTLQSGELELAPHGSSNIDVMPTSDLFSWTDGVRPSRRTGLLMLAVHGPPTVAKEILPARTLPVSLTMMKLSPAWTSFWSHAFVTLILLLGGLLSLIGNSVLPNTLRKISMRRQVNDLTDRVNSVSTQVDTYLRMLLKLERKKIHLQLRGAWAFSPSSVETLDQISVAIDRLSKRLKVAERLDELRRGLEDVSATAPPSVADDIDGKLQMGAYQLYPFALTEEEVHAANKFLDAAETPLGMLGDADALAQLVAANFRDLKVRQKLLPYAYYNDLKTALPGLFEMLNQPFDDFRNITRTMMFAIDYGIAALQTAFDFAILRANAPATAIEATSDSGPDQSARDRLLAHQKELINLLGTLSWAALREMRALVHEMRENIYERDVLEEIGTIGQAEIVFNPRTVRPYLPLLFSIRFKDPRFNDAAAIRRLTFNWDFPNELLEQNWKICHFFQGNEPKRDEGRDITVSVRVESQKHAEPAVSIDGRSITRPLRNALSTTVEIHRAERPSYSRALAEAVRFLIAFGVALAGLLSGALQQLEKLDFLPAMIAVLAIGFGADTIKNLFTQTSKKTAI